MSPPRRMPPEAPAAPPPRRMPPEAPAAPRTGKASAPPSAYERIYGVICRIPRGRVASYGEVARMAGLGGAARQVGYALHALPEASLVPWQRVVNVRGEIPARASGYEVPQRRLLEREGVRFDARGRIDLLRYGWDGAVRPARPAPRPRRSRHAAPAR